MNNDYNFLSADAEYVFTGEQYKAGEKKRRIKGFKKDVASTSVAKIGQAMSAFYDDKTDHLSHAIVVTRNELRI